MKYVARRKQHAIIHDATNDEQFAKDIYIQSNDAKSILCSPIVHHGDITAILYLENSLTTGAFTPDRLEVLKMISAQGAISIENARLYNTLEQKSDRTHRFQSGS